MYRLYFFATCLMTSCLASPGAAAQPARFPGEARAVQSLSVGYAALDFSFDGEETPFFAFDFDQPVLALIYTRPQLMATFLYGTQDADAEHESLRLLDVSLTTWGELPLPGFSAGPTRLFVPVALLGTYRRVTPRTGATSLVNAFNVTVLGLGAGLGVDRDFGGTTYLGARVHPTVGFTTSTLTDSFGFAYLVDADVLLHRAAVFGRFGLSLGYAFRFQVWNVNASSLFPESTDDLFDYRGRHHLIRLGVNW